VKAAAAAVEGGEGAGDRANGVGTAGVVELVRIAEGREGLPAACTRAGLCGEEEEERRKEES